MARRRRAPGRGTAGSGAARTREELGLEVEPADLALARDTVVEWDFRRDRVRVFELRLREEPVIRVDNREVVAARFVEPQALLEEEVLPPFIRAYLVETAADGGSLSAARGGHRRTPC